MKNFVKNVGFICAQCKKIVTDGIKHDNEEDLCDQCKIEILQGKLNELQKADSCRGWKLENGKIIYYCNIFSDYKKERSLKEVVEDLNQMTRESDRAWEIRTLYQGLKNELAEKEKELHYKNCECEKWKRDYENCSRLEKTISKERQYCLDNWNASEQEKISFCIEKLEKVKEEILKISKAEIKTLKNGYSTLYIDRPEVVVKIDNQIEELKKEIR